jgi:hypothetical protein
MHLNTTLLDRAKAAIPAPSSTSMSSARRPLFLICPMAATVSAPAIDPNLSKPAAWHKFPRLA